MRTFGLATKSDLIELVNVSKSAFMDDEQHMLLNPIADMMMQILILEY